MDFIDTLGPSNLLTARYGASALPIDSEFLSKVRSHPLRQSLTEEMHSRKMPPLNTPAHLLQIIVLTEDVRSEALRQHLQDLIGPARPLDRNLRYHRSSLGEIDLVWERHTEFASYTFINHGPCQPVFSQQAFSTITPEWLAAMPGTVIRATRIALIKQTNGVAKEDLERHFSPNDLVCCELANGRAQLFSDFRIHPEGNGRLLIVDRDLRGIEAAQLVQRVQELGNYRKMALLGLPVAAAGAAQIEMLERRLAALTGTVAEHRSDPSTSLEELSELSGELAALTAESRYRMSASEAYGGMVQDRLRSLQVRTTRGHLSLEDFTERRFLPAIRTCASFSKRLEDLAERAEWTSGLLRTKIDTALAAQNRDLLASMDRRASAQLRLQQAVEAVSFVAIAYYTLGILSYAIEPLKGLLSVETALAALVPGVLGATWLGLRRTRNKIERA